MLHKMEDWIWLGNSAHFACGRWCRFHLATVIGPWLVSTVGEYVHPTHSNGSEQCDREWWSNNWPGEDIGCGRKYETMVFLAGDKCSVPDCGCSTPQIDSQEIDFDSYNLRGDAEKGHYQMCLKWADKSRLDLETTDAENY